ncbi:MAG TPA: serine/threonine protein kinase, partial [Candidatus Sumerlaeota bacterium]|nr:serine/threonine protein kinase [Candidatus Sumerlaeota bacterium]
MNIVAGKYEILEKIGGGGMGDVYRAHQLDVERTVALKMLSPALAADSAFRERFRQEARAAANLSHP